MAESGLENKSSLSEIRSLQDPWDFDIFFSDKAVQCPLERIACSDDRTTTLIRRGWTFSIGLKKK